jgi:colanic acid biosynthesis glycosyl transferase WcaI
MRVVLIHRYFWPDTPPYAHILREIALQLGETGNEVIVLTCQPSYNRAAVGRASPRERLSPNVEVRRWPVLPDRRFASLKAVNLIWFCIRLLLTRWSLGKVDVVMAASTPPIAVAKVGRWLAVSTRARFFYHKQDIYPEVVTPPGILRARRWASLLRWVDARTDRAADRVIVLSEDMAGTTEARGVKPDRVAVINNFDPWMLDGSAQPESAVEHPGDGVARVVFAGNLGRFQNLETIMTVVRLLKDEPGIEFHFFGTGALHRQIEQHVAGDRLTAVHLHGYRPPDEVAEFLRSKADLGIVSLMPGVIRAAYPSKTMSYLRQGCAVLALVESESALARTLTAAGAGFHADPADPADAAALIRRLAQDPDALRDAGCRAAGLYRAEFSADRQLDRWVRLFDDVRKRATT